MRKSDLGAEVIITWRHRDHTGKIRETGDKAKIYLGPTYGALDEGEKALVFEGEDFFVGIKTRRFKLIEVEPR